MNVNELFAGAQLDKLEEQRDELFNALNEIIASIPANDGKGRLYFDHWDGEGRFTFTEDVNPMDVIATIHAIAMAAQQKAEGRLAAVRTSVASGAAVKSTPEVL